MSINIHRRENMEDYRMRSGRLMTQWTRSINGRKYDFARIAETGGREGYTIQVREPWDLSIVHEFRFDAEGNWA